MITVVVSILFVALVSALLVYGLSEYRHKVRSEQLLTIDDPESSPTKITLEEVEHYGWLVEPEVQHTLRELEDLGFIQQGSFRVVEMPGLHVIGLIQADKNFIASVYADTRGTTWVDISAVSIKGEVFTTSNTLRDEVLLAQSPLSSLKVDKSWSVVELVAQQQALCGDLKLANIGKQSFASLFEKSYSNDVLKLNQSGGVLSRRAFQVQLESTGEDISEEELEEQYLAYVYRCGVKRLDRLCVEEYLSHNEVQIEEQKQIIAIHKGIPNSLISTFLTERLELNSKESSVVKEAIDSTNRLEDNFEVIKSLLKRFRFVKLGTVVEPTRAEIYKFSQI